MKSKAIFLSLLLLTLVVGSAYGATPMTCRERIGGTSTFLVCSWTADGAGAVSDTTVNLDGVLFTAKTTPGAPAPTVSYNITIEEPDGKDTMEGALLTRSDTVIQEVSPLVNGFEKPRPVLGAYTIKLTGNVVPGAKGVLTLKIVK